MPSTFTNNTGIEKIGDGEQTGAWGQTTNLNFDIVDRALNGSVSIALSGTTHTLTTSDGVLSDGQYAVLVFTGSPSGTNTVTIAPDTAQKTYVVRNTTAQSVVLTQGSGATVTVPAGLTKLVYANGGGVTAAVVDITNTLSGNLTGNVTGNVTGNLTGNVTGDVTGNVTTSSFTLGGTAVTATAAELNTLDGIAPTGSGFGYVPQGGIIMWSGTIASIPSGWVLCDGTNSTPDLRDRFVVGAGSGYAVGEQGGLGAVSLTEANLPAHTHTFSATTSEQSNNHTHGGTTSTNGEHAHTATTAVGTSLGGSGLAVAFPVNTETGRVTISAAGDHAHTFTTTGVSSDHTHNVGGTTGATGSGTVHENRPPYLALAYIMKA